MLIIISSLLILILLLVGLLEVWSYPGKPGPFLDESGHPLAGSLSEKVFINLNGIEQGMFIKSRDVTNPVLLYLHGGMPDYFLSEKYPTGLEDYFTVVWWEQRGSGLSYSPDIPSETLTLEQMISDTLAMTNYLQHRFGKEKIYLMGHSGGTFIGIQAAARAPSCISPTSASNKSRTSSDRNSWPMNICSGNSKSRATRKWCRGWKRRLLRSRVVHQRDIFCCGTSPCTVWASVPSMR